MQVWAAYSPVKNSPPDARAKAAAGSPSHSATTGELDIYRTNCRHAASACTSFSPASKRSRGSLIRAQAGSLVLQMFVLRNLLLAGAEAEGGHASITRAHLYRAVPQALLHLVVHYAAMAESALLGARCLQMLGVHIEGPEQREFNGLKVDLWPRVSWSPSFAITFADLEVQDHAFLLLSWLIRRFIFGFEPNVCAFH